MIAMPQHCPTVPTVLYIDDEEENRITFKATFRKDFNVVLAADLNEAWKVLEVARVHVVICDQRMPGVAGSEALRRIRERYPQVHRMLITAHADLQALVDALNEGGVCHYIQKPWEVDDVRRAVAQAWARHQAEMERKAFTEKLLESNRQLEFALRQSLLS
ncbi:MAG: response regulator [Flavobacteriales bacterium]|nr:response regulator [Flavobacteriales bacterium]